MRAIAPLPKPRSLAHALRNKTPLALLAEIKKASPSKGVIQPDFQPVKQALAYVAGGADALSVLTDETYFQGSVQVLKQVREAVTIPILRKDFIVDEWQVYESRAIGADAILLIAAALSEEQLAHLYHLATDLDLEVLLEVHSELEWAQVASLHPAIVGINNRDLRTFEVNLEHTVEIAKAIAPETLIVSESGLARHEDVLTVQKAGASAILVGETLMRSGVDGALQAIAALLYGVPAS